jgi:tRNA modification GTPase
LTLWLSDAAEANDAPLPVAGPIIAILTKADRWPAGGDAAAASGGPIRISALTGAGVEQLLDAVADLAEERMAGPAPALITLERHRAAFAEALGALERALDPAARELELVAEDLRLAARALERIAGRIDVEEVLGDIFSRLCVGK